MTLPISPSTPRDDLKLLCAIPVYNNAATVFDVVNRCLKQITHVLVIDDGSADADLRELLKPLNVTVIRHPENQGKGRVLLTAFHYAATHGVDYVITLDGDGQHFPEDVPRFFTHLSPDAILIGYRAEVSGVMPRSSQFGRKFSDFWIYVETGRCACDTQSGFRVYPTLAVSQLKLDSHFYNFEMEILTKALWAGLRAQAVPIRVWYPAAEERVSSFNPFRDNLRIAMLHVRMVLYQLLPIPHRALQNVTLSKPNPLPGRHSWNRASAIAAEQAPASPSTWLLAIVGENSGALGLSVVTAISIIMTLVLWPWGFVPIAYLTLRLHLNKLAALICIILFSPSSLHRLCAMVGRRIVSAPLHPHLAWLAGSHLIALPLAAAASVVVYKIAGRFEASDSDSV